MTSGYSDQLLRATEIHDKFVDESTAFDKETKHYFKILSKSIRDFLTTNPKANTYHLRTMTNELVRYWKGSINSDTERFWAEIYNNHIDIDRKDPLVFALKKKRFRIVEHGIDARNNWAGLKHMKSVTDRFSKADIKQIEKIIADDEQKRLDVLTKCLRKKAVPPTMRLKFGDCIAYFANCKLFDKYFTTEQMVELDNIWRNLK